jgi:hypothetical protein
VITYACIAQPVLGGFLCSKPHRPVITLPPSNPERCLESPLPNDLLARLSYAHVATTDSYAGSLVPRYLVFSLFTFRLSWI